MRWIPATMGHLQALDLHPSQLHQDVRDRMTQGDDALREHARTGMNGADHPLVVVGCWPIGNQIGLAWLFGSLAAQEHGVAYARGVKRLLDEWLTRYDRIRATAEDGAWVHLDFLLWLGFERKTLLEHYFGGQDHWLLEVEA